MNTEHIADEQFAALLAGETPDGETAAHLDACAFCHHELASMRLAMNELRDLTLQWAEGRAHRIVSPSRWMLGWHPMRGWSVAASVLLLGLALGIHIQNGPRQPAPEIGQVQTISVPSDGELAEDNRLLQSIDQELNQQVHPQVPASELSISTRTPRHRVPSEVSN
jgi:hypothetical protein